MFQLLLPSAGPLREKKSVTERKAPYRTNSFKGRLLSPPRSVPRAPLTPAGGGRALLRTAPVFSPQYEVAIATEKGVEVEGPLTLEANWDIAHLVR